MILAGQDSETSLLSEQDPRVGLSAQAKPAVLGVKGRKP